MTIARHANAVIRVKCHFDSVEIDVEIRAIRRPYRSPLIAIPIQFGMFKHDFSHDSRATGLVIG